MSSSCNNEDDEITESTTVELNFRGLFGNEDLLMIADDYAYEDMQVRFQLFQFYISDVTLIGDPDKGTIDQALVDIGLVSFEDVNNSEAAQEGITISAEDIPPGKYNGIRLGIGVSEDLNATNPGLHPVGHPLTDHYWTASSGYVFFKIEGNADLDQNGEFEEKLTFHTGTNELYRELTFSQAIEVGEGTTTIPFRVDLRKVLVRASDDFLDFRQTPIDHTSNPEVAQFLADNFANALVLE